jgi:hypothetical protein
MVSSLLLRPRMRNVIGVNDVHHRKVRVLLRVAQGCVTQTLRDRHDVGAVLQHVGCKAVAQPRLDYFQALGIKRCTLAPHLAPPHLRSFYAL